MSYIILQCQLSQEVVDLVNEYGWDVAPTYPKLSGFPKPDTCQGLIVSAVLSGFYSHTMTVDSDDLVEVFAAGNGYGTTKVKAHRRHKSMSIGDIAMKRDGQGYKAFLCIHNGWHELSPDLVEWIQTKVSIYEE